MAKREKLEGPIGKAYQHLRQEIIYNRLKPGEALSETDLAEKMDVSRTPVREALMKLANEGLVTRYPSRGCFVSPITVKDVAEIYELRIQLECCALRNSCRHISDQELEEIEGMLLALRPDSPEEMYFDSDRKLHGLLLAYCGNGRLVDYLGILAAQIERVRVISALKNRRLSNSRLEHIELVDALKARDIPRSEKLLASHLGNVRDSSIEVCKYMSMAEYA